jgi:hypothetical protein
MGIKSLLAVAGALALATPAFAASNPFMGVWHVASVKPAPWSADAKAKSKVDGYLVKVGDGRVYGPSVLDCRGAHYAVSKVAPGLLFGGNVKNAQALGFSGGQILTMTASGCSNGNEFDYAMVNRHEVLVDAGNVIYTLKR